MDLVATVYGDQRPEQRHGLVPVQSKWFYESSTLCTVSSQNTVAFVSAYPLLPSSLHPNADDEGPLPMPYHYRSRLGADKGGSAAFHGLSNKGADEPEQSPTQCEHFVYICDLNTPWDVQLVTSKPHEITTIAWEPEQANTIVFSDTSGRIEVWQMKQSLISDWHCISKSQFSGETFLKSFFITGMRKTFINMDHTDAGQYHDKFSFRSGSMIGQEFAQREMFGVLLISHTGLAACISIPKFMQEQALVKTAQRSLDASRGRIRTVDIAFIKDGTLLVSTSNGDPNAPIRFYSMKPSFKDTAYDSGFELILDIDSYPGLFTKAIGNGERSEEDKCLGIVGLSFVNGDDTDSFVVATKHPAGGRLELWELKEFQQNIHKMFLTSIIDQSQSTFSLPAWHYVEQFSGPVSQIVSIATPKYCFQTGRAAACYVTVAYSDGSIQCLIRDNLQQIGSVDLPRSGNLYEEPSMKLSRASVTICDMSFSSTGNALVTIDSLGQLYMYRMSPITDPGGPHVPAGLQTMFEFCLVSGIDWWDVAVCLKSSHVETVCFKLEEDFGKQPKSNQEYYFSRFMAITSSLYRQLCSSSIEYKCADNFAQLMLHSVYGSFKTLLGPSDLTITTATAVEKVSKLLEFNKKDEANVDALVDGLHSIHAEFAVEPNILQSYQHLIQWVTNLTLHLLASVPEYKHKKGPGGDLISDKTSLTMMREMLFIIRLWGKTNEGILPSFTKTADSFDVLAKLFSLLTRYKEGKEGSNEAIIDECILLPSQVMIPPLDIIIPPRGLSHNLVTHNRGGPLACQFLAEPELLCEGESGGVSRGAINGKFDQTSLIDGAVSTKQCMDNVRHIFLGKRPYVIKECTRCAASSLPISSSKKVLNKGWDQRWASKCPCGGPWKLTCLDDNFQRRNLLSCI